ncbi:T1SS-143 repeat domain-containing protein [Neorhizobium sp. LjRoot104]|uniref:T1SS-143 repeat domain-containing protein n=1 Tax=Neorhizobium sp. LjRoot104 TaxID=3342254 RepID=UPI003ECEA426
MSVEDPRLSNISEENLTENFSSEIQEEIAASSTPSPIEHEIQVAQAGDSRTPTTNRIPTDPNAPAAAPAAPAAEVAPDANNIVHLATSVSIDDIRVDGANLILVQADGTEIVIVNGAAKIPTMLIGEVEVPQQVLFAALEDSGINVAAGPDGSFSASGRPDSSGADFEDSIQQSQNDPIQLASLLGDTEFGDGAGLDDRTAADDQPDAFDMGSPFIFSESVLADDVVGNETITGTLAFDGGDDFGIVSSVNYQSTSDMAEGTGSGVAAPLTSGGQPVTVSTSADGLTVTGTITVGETTVTVFTLTVTNPITGAFTYTQSQPLDHPDLGEIGADDALRLNFTFTVTDKDGDSDTGSFSIEIGDDGPSIGGAVTLVSVDEDDLSNGNDEGEARESLVTSATLGISWGADANVKGESEGDTFGRSIAFNGDGLPQGLTSGGVGVVYGAPTVSANGIVTITAFKGSIEGPAVFTVTLDPTSEHGTATFELKGALDHASESNALPLTFNYTATDADGDSQIGSFSVTVDDDIPTVGENSLVQLDDDALTGGNPAGNGDDADSVNATGFLAHAYGADGAGSVLWIGSGLTLPAGFTATPSEDGKVMTIFQGERAVVSITITDTVTGAYQVTQLAPINHPQGTIPGTEDNVQFTISYQVTDKDGDAAATPGTLTINVDDDIPTIGANALVQLDDDTLTGGNPAGNGDDADSVNATGFLAHAYGADGAGSVLWIGSGLTLPAGFTATPSEDGKVMTIFQGERAVVSITITDTVTGAYQVTQLAPIDHPQGTIPGTEDNVQFTISYQATDKDGDAAATPGTLTINVDDDTPTVVSNDTLKLDDDTLGGNANGVGDDTTTATSGILGHSFGADVAGSISWSGSGLTLPYGFWFARSEDGSQLTITQNQNGTYVPVFKLVIDSASTGAYHVEQLAPVNHDGSNPGFEDNVSVTVSYDVKDGDNDVATGTLTIDIDDDTAQIGTPFAGGIVEEEQGAVIGAGNEDTGGTGDADGFGGFLGLQFQDRTTQNTGGTLAISWGSDNADNEAITSGAGNRSVSFGPAAIANLEAQNLSSRGLDLVYTLSADGTVLTAHAGTETGQTVFTVTLSDNGSGSYSFTLVDTLDHPASGEDQIALNFQFTATDSDGDTTAPAIFTVKVIDDVPTAGTVFARYVEEEALSGGNEDVSPIGVELSGAVLNGGLITDKIGASLNISWGGDDSNTTANGGFTGTQVMGDRSIVFAASASVAATVVSAADAAAFMTVKSGNTTIGLDSLTSGGQALVYTLSQNGTVLVAHAGSASGVAVFTVTLSDTGSGRYDFDLDGVLDHPVKASGAGNEDVLTFTFTATARDGDGDIVKNNFQVNVIDDSPVANPGTASTVEDESVNSGNNEAGDGYSAKAEHVSLNIQWGADNANDGNGQPGDRSVAFRNANVTVAGEAGNSLTSLGVEVHTAILANGTVVGYTGNTAPTTTGAGNVVFFATVSDVNNGEYNFTLVKPLDHDTSPANSENSLSLTFNYTATDSDGDSSSSTFTVNIVDDVAQIGTPFAGGIVEEEQGAVIGAGNEDMSGAGDADALFGLLDRTTQNTGGTLAISWGSDNADNEAITSGAGNRSVSFGPAAIANLEAQNLSSRGLDLVYTLSADGTVLTAHAGTETGQTVFTVTLSDNGSGSYSFTLVDTLDHPASGEDQIALNFQFTATDSDGDTTAPAIFTVKVIDDVPTAGTVFARYVEEEALSGGNEDVSPIGVELSGAVLNGGLITDKIGASLNISWGGDDSNTTANGGFTGTQVMGDRSIVFAASASVAATVVSAADAAAFMTVKSGNTTIGLDSLTSGGQALVYTLSQNGTVLVAHAGSASGVAVFTVTLSDTGSGRYDFDLDGVLDHPVKASGAGNEDVLTFTFTATARDGDGDIVKNNFQVNVIDDSPVIAGPAGSGNVSEVGLPSVSFDFDSLNVKIGADKNNHVAIGTDVHGDPMINAGLTSDGVALKYAILTTNGVDQQLVAFKDGDTVDSPVFIVSVVHPGSFVVTLHQNLDHPAGSDNLTLDLVARVYDGDGDFVDQPFHIDVADGVATVGAAPEMQTVFEDGTRTLSAVPLSISWGNDDANPDIGNNDRSVTFAKPVAANNVTVSGPAGALANLTSNGNQVQFAFVGAYLVAYIGSTVPASATDANLVVFNVLLSDLASGSYTFNLLQPLDHPAPAGTADYIDLAFTYHATDSDHDTTAEQTFVVRVDAAGSIDSINYSNLTSGVFVNLDDDTHIVLGQTVAGDRATDGALVTDKIVGIDNVTGINDALGGSADDVLIGGDEANKLTGNGGNDYLDGGLGADILDGGAGNDTFVLGADVTGSGTRNIQLGDGSLLAVDIDGLAGTADKVVGGTGSDTIILERDGKPGFVADYSTAPGYLSGVEKIVGTDGNDVILLAAGSTADGGPITIEGGDGNDILGGSNSADIINGGDDNDLISGLGGDDTLSGGNGDDVIWGGLGADTIHGGAGSDIINLGADQIASGLATTLDSVDGGADYDKIVLTTGTQGFLLDGNVTTIAHIEEIAGTDGNDTITLRDDYLSDQANGGVTINGGKGDDTITGGKGNDVITGGEGIDTLKGGAGADTLIGGAGNDVLWGGKHSDSLFGNGTTNIGADLNATAGETDTAAYGGAASDYRVFFTPNFTGGGDGIWQVEALNGAPEYTQNATTDNLYGIELIQFANGVVLDLTDPVRVFNGTNLVGTYDTIQLANDAATTLAGYRIELVGTVTDEDATITKENLTVVGGDDDTGINLTLDGVQNIVLGGTAPINVVGNDLSNGVQGNDGANVITSGKSGDTLNGGDGDDTFIVSADLDDATGQGSRTVTLGDGSTVTVSLDHLSGEGDSLNGGAGVDTVEFVSAAGATGFVFDRANYPGTLSGVERFIGTDGSDIILLPQSYTSGTDPLYMEGGAGDDVLQGSNVQADHILGGSDNDLISGLGGNDTLDGGSGDDEIWGGEGDDKIYGNADNDTLIGGKGDDLLDGGSNSAVAFNHPSNPASGDAAAIIASALGGDTADYSSVTTGVLANLGDATTWPAAIPAHSAIDSNAADDAVGTDTLVGIENLTGGSANDVLVGDGNDNILRGGAGSDTLLGGAGNDLLIAGDDNVADGLFAGSGDDVLILGNGGGTAKGGGGNDLIYGGSDGDWLYGEDDGNPDSDPGDDIIFAAGGNDHIEGNGGNDKLYGEDGNDTLVGGHGDDQMSGGAGDDTFVYTRGDGSDTIDGGGDIDTLTISKGTAVAGVYETRIGGTASGIEIQLTDNIAGMSPGDALLGAAGVEKFDVQIGDYETAIVGTSGHGNLVGVTDVKITGSDQGNTLSSAYLTSDTKLTANLAGGDDLFIAGNQTPAAVVDGGDGIDTVIYNQLSAPRVEIDLQLGIVDRFNNATDVLIAQDLITNFENAEGTINNDTLRGTDDANTLVGNAGDDVIEGRGGNDVLSGGAGNDTFIYKVGDGNDIVDGGEETGTSNLDYDILKIAGDAVQRSFTIAKATGGTDIVAGINATDILVSYTGANGATVRADEIERIEVTLGSAGDSIAVGDLSGTAIAPTTVVINGGVGSDTIDLTGLVGTKVEINDVDDTTGGDIDTVKLAGKWSDYDIVRATDGTFTFSLGGHVVATAKNIEQFTFQGENGGAGGTMQAIDLINDAPHAAADNNTGDPVVEAGGVANGTAGDASAIGNVLTNDTDADAFDSKHVTAIQFGAGPATAVPAGNGDVTIAGAYGILTIHSDGSYAYALDNNDSDTQALGQGAAASDVFTYTMADAHGLTSSASLTINITGTNDTPTLTASLGGKTYIDTAADDSFNAVIGTLTGSDRDATETLIYGIEGGTASNAMSGYNIAKTGSYGVLYVNSSNGAYTFVPNDGAIEGLKSNGSETFTLNVTDGSNATATQSFVVNLTGTNDTPTLTASLGGKTYIDTAADDSFNAVTGTLTGSDRDAADTLTFGIQGGSASNAMSGYNIAKTGSYGVLYVNSSNGAYTFVPNDGAIEGLKSNGSETFTLNVTDGSNATATQSFVVNLTGANDTAVITGISSGTVTEATPTNAGVAIVTGNLMSTDADDQNDLWQAVSSATSTPSGYGSYTINAQGVWTYSLNNANSVVNALNSGSQLSDSFVVKTADGTAKTVNITIQGATDTAAEPNSYNLGKGDNRDVEHAVDLTNAAYSYLKSTDADVTNAVTSPTITVNATTSAKEFDFYKLVITENGTTVRFDVDGASFDTWLVLQKDGQTIGQNDDVTDVLSSRDKGSSSNLDSYLTATLNAGTYYLKVGEWNSSWVEEYQDKFNNSNDTYTLHVSIVSPSGDPIVLDLGNAGISFTSLENGVAFDVNGDGVADKTAWMGGEDGVLSMDINGNGRIENGKEIFSTVFGGGSYNSSLAALGTIDSNGDGVIDSKDFDFGKLLVWQDANHDGISDVGELKSLTEIGISSISLTTVGTSEEIDGQAVSAHGQFTFEDGTAGAFVEVDFDKSIGAVIYGDYSHANSLVGTDGDDILAALPGLTQMTGGAGADTFVLDPSALHELDMADVITDYKSSEGDAVDVSKLLDTLLGHQATGEEAAANVRTTISGNDTTVSVQVATDSWKDVAVLQNHTEAVKILFDDDKHSANLSHV